MLTRPLWPPHTGPQLLSLRGLPLPAQLIALMALGSILAYSLLLLLFAFVPGLAEATSGGPLSAWNSSIGAFVLRVTTVGGVALAFAAGTAAACYTGSAWRRVPVVAVALLGMALAGVALHQAGFPGLDGVPVGSLQGLVARAAAWLGVTSAMVLALLPLRGRGDLPVAVALSVLPVCCWVLALMVLGRLDDPWQSNAGFRSDSLPDLMDTLQVLLLAYLVWAAFEWARLVGIVGTRVAWVFDRGRLLPAVLTAKLVWLAAGYTGLLPWFLGGASPAWARSSDDGIGSWVTAGVLAAAAVTWLLAAADGRAVVNGPVIPGLLAFGALLVLPAFLAGAVDVVGTTADALEVWSPQGRGSVLVVVAAAIGIVALLRHDRVRAAALGLVASAAVLGLRPVPEPTDGPVSISSWATVITGHYFLAGGALFLVAWFVLVRRGGSRLAPAAAVCFAIAAPVALFHVAPRLRQVPLQLDNFALGATGDLYTPLTADVPFPSPPVPWESLWGTAGGTFEAATFDAWLTVLVLLALLWARPRRRDGLALAVVVSTVAGQADILSPSTWLGQPWFYLALLFPVAAELLFARDLNQGGEERTWPLLATLAALLGLLTIAVFRVRAGLVPADTGFEEQVFGYNRGLTMDFWTIPIVALVVAGLVTRPEQAEP